MTKKKKNVKEKPKPLKRPLTMIDRASSQKPSRKMNPKSFAKKVFRKGSMFLTQIGRPVQKWEVNQNRSLRIEHDALNRLITLEQGELKTQMTVHDQDAQNKQKAEATQTEKPSTDGRLNTEEEAQKSSLQKMQEEVQEPSSV